MSRGIVYAIGGTGAKLLESLVQLCAAGVVTDNLSVRIVDQDQSNGNAKRTQESLAAYRRARASLRGSSGEACGHTLFAAEIDGGEEVLRVVPNLEDTLASAFGLGTSPHPDEEANDLLMQALFTDEERRRPMANGFRGLPAVGAAVFLSPAADSLSTLWETVKSDIGDASSGKVSHFLMLGSAFGGTGASGVPTIGGYIRDALRGNPKAPRVGAVLMLRYFTVSGQSQFGPAQPAQIKEALQFYHTVLSCPQGRETDRLFDTLYLAGLSREATIPAEPNGGGGGQANPALLPELVGALGAAHFLNRKGIIQEGSSQWRDEAPGKPVWLCGHTSPHVLGWNDLPDAGVG